MEKKKIVFMGTPAIAAGLLDSLFERDDIEVVMAVTQPDKKQGRKQKLVFSPVKESALAHGVEVFQPVKIREDYQPIIDAAPDLIVTCAYGQIVPKALLDAPVYGCINLHGSLLPALRGGAPIQRAIWQGFETSGMSLMKMAPAMDAGPVMAQDAFALAADETTTSLFQKMEESAIRLLDANLETILSGHAVYMEQDPALVTFAPVISKQEEELDLTKPDLTIERQVRALAQTPGAYVKVKGKKLKILKAVYVPGTAGTLGEFVSYGKNRLGLQLHDGLLELESVQMEGKPVMETKNFMNGQGKALPGCVIDNMKEEEHGSK